MGCAFSFLQSKEAKRSEPLLIHISFFNLRKQNRKNHGLYKLFSSILRKQNRGNHGLYIYIDLVVGDVLETKASNPSQFLPSCHTRSCSWAARCFSSNSAMSRVHRHVASLVLEGRPRARQQGGKGNVHMLLCNNMHALAGIDTGRKTKKLKKR